MLIHVCRMASALCLLSVVFIGNTSAAILTYDTRAYGDNSIGNPLNLGGASNTTGAQYLAAYQTLALSPPTTGYGDNSISAWQNVSNSSVSPGGFNQHIAYDETAKFYVAPNDTGSWSFQVGADFDFGGTLLIDGVAVQTRNDNFYDANTGFTATINLGSGNHTVQLVGFEGCCDGPTNAAFKDPLDSEFQIITSSDLANPTTPEPSTLVALLGCGIMGLVMLARRRRRS